MANILYSAYFCKPGEGSESYTAVKWLEILLKEHNVTVLTNRSSADGLKEYFKEMPSNLKIIGFDVPAWLEKKRNVQLHFGYFSFDRQSYKYVKAHKALLEWTDVILKKTPSSFRYFTSLYKLRKPLVIGPVGGGIQNPPELKAYFKKEPFINKLRALDSFLLAIPPFSSQLKQTSKILITLDYLRDILPGKYESKMTTIFDTGIDSSDLNKEKNAEDVNRPLQLLYVGKLIRYKGAELLIRSIVPLKNKLNFQLHIVGDGIERHTLENLVAANGLGSVVKFYGNLSRDHVFDYYRNADIFCFPSLTEASGNVLLEAMLYSLPVITINNGGPKYMCPEEGTVKINIQKEEGIITELTEALVRLMGDAELRKRMGEANYRFLQANFSWDVLQKKINDFFHQYDNVKAVQV